MGEGGYRRWDLMLTHACWGEWLNFFVYTQFSYIASILFMRINLRSYARTNYATVEIHPKRAAT